MRNRKQVCVGEAVLLLRWQRPQSARTLKSEIAIEIPSFSSFWAPFLLLVCVCTCVCVVNECVCVTYSCHLFFSLPPLSNPSQQLTPSSQSQHNTTSERPMQSTIIKASLRRIRRLPQGDHHHHHHQSMLLLPRTLMSTTTPAPATEPMSSQEDSNTWCKPADPYMEKWAGPIVQDVRMYVYIICDYLFPSHSFPPLNIYIGPRALPLACRGPSNLSAL